MHPFHAMLAAAACLALLGFGLLLRAEWRSFHRRGLGAAWWRVRLATIPAGALTAAGVVLPAQAVSGPEALAVFYLLLLAVAPLVWFGVHLAAARLGRPPLSLGDGLRLAALPPAYLLALAALAVPLQPLAWSLLRSMGLA